MKNNLKSEIAGCVVILIILFSSSLNAQILSEFGIKGGANFAILSNLDGSETKTGILAGVYTKIKIPVTPVSVQTEVLYAQYGAKQTGGDQDIILNYIQVPVLLKFGFNVPAAPVKPNVFFGPYLSFKTKAEFENSVAVNPDSFNNNVRDQDYGVVVGAGLDIGKLRFNLRYSAGLINIFEEGANGEKNGGIAITFGVAL
ncbi:MAG: porin family protein [Balneola sp.]